MKKNDSDVIIIEVATTMLRLIIINKESNKIIATSNVNIDYIKRGVVKDVGALTKSIRSLISQTNKNYLNNIKKVVIALSGGAISSFIILFLLFIFISAEDDMEDRAPPDNAITIFLILFK